MNVINHSVGLPSRGVPRRLLVALAMSICGHYLIVSSWVGSSRARHPETAQAPLHAQLVPPPPRLAVEAETVAMPLAEADALPVKTTSMLRRVPPATIPAAVGPQASAATEGFDDRFYLARELDQYPAPLSTLSLNEITSADTVDSVRLWVSINQTGRVVDAVLIDAELPRAFAQSVREKILATRFTPARRDGRVVQSRVLLVLRGNGGL